MNLGHGWESGHGGGPRGGVTALTVAGGLASAIAPVEARAGVSQRPAVLRILHDRALLEEAPATGAGQGAQNEQHIGKKKGQAPLVLVFLHTMPA